MRTSPEGISGYSGALAAVLGGVRFSPLGVPHTKGKVRPSTSGVFVPFFPEIMYIVPYR